MSVQMQRGFDCLSRGLNRMAGRSLERFPDAVRHRFDRQHKLRDDHAFFRGTMKRGLVGVHEKSGVLPDDLDMGNSHAKHVLKWNRLDGGWLSSIPRHSMPLFAPSLAELEPSTRAQSCTQDSRIGSDFRFRAATVFQFGPYCRLQKNKSQQPTSGTAKNTHPISTSLIICRSRFSLSASQRVPHGVQKRPATHTGRPSNPIVAVRAHDLPAVRRAA